METLPEDASQGSQPRMIEEAGRVKRRLRNLKGLLTREVSACIDKIGFFKNKYPDNSTVTTVKIDYAKDILETLSQCQIRFTNLEKDVEDLKMLLCDTWEDEDDELEMALEGLTQEISK